MKVIILSIGLQVTWTIIISMNIACFATRGVCEFIGVAHTACHLPDIILRTLSCCAARAFAMHHYMTPPVEGRLPAIARRRPTPVRAPSWEHYYDYLYNLCICCYICMGEVYYFPDQPASHLVTSFSIFFYFWTSLLSIAFRQQGCQPAILVLFKIYGG